LRHVGGWGRLDRREFVVGLPPKHSTGCSLLHPPPLLEEERDPLLPAPIANREDPLLAHRSRAGSPLSPNNHPVHPLDAEISQVLQERLDGEEPHGCPRFAKTIHPWEPVLAILNTDAEPDLASLLNPRSRADEVLHS